MEFACFIHRKSLGWHECASIDKFLFAFTKKKKAIQFSIGKVIGLEMLVFAINKFVLSKNVAASDQSQFICK